MNLEFSRQSFEKYTNIKFHENPSSGRRVVPREQTDSHDEAKRHFSHFLRMYLNMETAETFFKCHRTMYRDTGIRIREMTLKLELTTIHVCNQNVLMGVVKYILKFILKPRLD